MDNIEVVTCWNCNGTGAIEEWNQVDAFGGEMIGDCCPECGGEGVLVMEDPEAEESLGVATITGLGELA